MVGDNKIKGKKMKRLLILVFITISIANAWELKKVIDSEGIQTNVIQCDNGSIKAVYFSSDSGKYEVTPTVMFDILDEASRNVCGE